MKRFLKQNWFILGLGACVACGFFLPEIGIFLSAGSFTSNALVVVIFFISGWTLPREVIHHGLKDLRLHILIQVFVFVVAPLYFLVGTTLMRPIFSPEMLIGIYALACLPTTISSCVIFTQTAGGNVVGTMFNSALANILGIFVSPLLLSFLLNRSGHTLEINEALRIFAELGSKMLVPVVAGQIARKFFLTIAERNKKRMGYISNSGILLIVLITMSKTAQNPLFFRQSGMNMPVLIFLAFSFIFLALLAYGLAKMGKFSHPNLVSVIFTAPQKTLALGVPLLSTYFANDAALKAVAILPILFYHPWQLFVSGIIKDMPFISRSRKNS